MDTDSPHRRTLDEIDEREALKRERFAHLALIAPTPEMIRQVMALQDEAPSSRTAAIAIVADPEPVPADH